MPVRGGSCLAADQGALRCAFSDQNDDQARAFLALLDADAESDARAAAIADAGTKAAELAELSGVPLGNIVSISEVIGAGGGFYAGNFAQQARAFGGGSTPITPGQLDLVMQLQVIYAIDAAE